MERNFSDTGSCGFSFGNGCSLGYSNESLFGKRNKVDVIHLQLKRPRTQEAEQES